MMKFLKTIKIILGIIFFFSLFVLPISAGSETVTTKSIIVIIISLICFVGGSLGYQVIQNEIEYKERKENKRK